MSNKQQTAVEQLFNLIESIPSGGEELNQMKELLISKKPLFKEMEKKQIINAVDGFPLPNRGLNGDEYYEQTYGGNSFWNI